MGISRQIIGIKVGDISETYTHTKAVKEEYLKRFKEEGAKNMAELIKKTAPALVRLWHNKRKVPGAVVLEYKTLVIREGNKNNKWDQYL